MEAQVAQCTAVSQKSEREYITLRDAIKHLGDGWKQDVERLKREMHERETKWKKEAEDVGFKYRRLLSQVEKERALQTSVKELKAEEERVKREWEDALLKQIQELRTGIQRGESETSTAGKTAQYVSTILRSYYACACVFFISNVHVCSMFCAHAPFTGTSRTSCRDYEVSSGPFRVRQPKKTMTEELA